MAANNNLKVRLDHLGIAYVEGTKAITLSGVTLSEAQLASTLRAAEAQGYAVTLAAGVLTLSSRS